MDEEQKAQAMNNFLVGCLDTAVAFSLQKFGPFSSRTEMKSGLMQAQMRSWIDYFQQISAHLCETLRVPPRRRRRLEQRRIASSEATRRAAICFGRFVKPQRESEHGKHGKHVLLSSAPRCRAGME